MIGGSHLSAGRREGKGAVWEVAIRQGATGARPAGPRGRDGPTERPRPSGEGGEEGRWKRKEDGPRLGRKAGWVESDGKILFRIKFDF
jgi:hypothetical protein